MDIEKKLCPNAGKLIIKKIGIPTAQILDAELDVVDLSFHGDGIITINPGKLSWIDLTPRNLEQMSMLLDEANKYYDKKYKRTKNKELNKK